MTETFTIRGYHQFVLAINGGNVTNIHLFAQFKCSRKTMRPVDVWAVKYDDGTEVVLEVLL